MKEIYYQYEDEIEAPASDVTVDVPITATPATPVISSTAVSTPSSESVASMEDVLIKAIDVVTQKLKKRLDEIPLSKSIKDLVGGKSTLQNEILGDLQQEFASAPEKGEELPLEELGSALGSGFSGALGKYSTGSYFSSHWRQNAWWFQFVGYQELSQQELGTMLLSF